MLKNAIAATSTIAFAPVQSSKTLVKIAIVIEQNLIPLFIWTED